MERMLHAITSGDCRAVQKLLRKHRGWKNRHLLNTGNTPLMIAAGTGKSLVLQLLLDSKADVDVRSRGMGPQAGATALLISAVTGNCVCARKLLDAKANPNFSAADGTSPLHGFAQEGVELGVTLLLKAKAAVNAMKRTGVTPLMSSATFGHPGTAFLLIKAKADVHAKNRTNDLGPLFAAATEGHDKVFELRYLSCAS